MNGLARISPVLAAVLHGLTAVDSYIREHDDLPKRLEAAEEETYQQSQVIASLRAELAELRSGSGMLPAPADEAEVA